MLGCCDFRLFPVLVDLGFGSGFSFCVLFSFRVLERSISFSFCFCGLLLLLGVVVVHRNPLGFFPDVTSGKDIGSLKFRFRGDWW